MVRWVGKGGEGRGKGGGEREWTSRPTPTSWEQKMQGGVELGIRTLILHTTPAEESSSTPSRTPTSKR